MSPKPKDTKPSKRMGLFLKQERDLVSWSLGLDIGSRGF